MKSEIKAADARAFSLTIPTVEAKDPGYKVALYTEGTLSFIYVQFSLS